MTLADSAQTGGLFAGETWTWWQARRRRYNIVLAAAGWVAYGTALLIAWAFGRPIWQNWQGGVAMTLFLGAGFLALMGIANIAYLLGPAVEAWTRPSDVARYRRSAYAMGLLGSAAVPFLMPLANLAIAIGQSAPH